MCYNQIIGKMSVLWGEIMKKACKTILFFAALAAAVMLITSVSCGSSKDEGKVPKAIISGTEKAVSQKYGIKAKVTQAEANYEWEGFDFIIPHKKYTCTYSLTLKADDAEINALVGANGSVKDDYQHTEIEESLQAYFGEMIPSPIRVKSSIGLLEEKVDCTDMEGFIREHNPPVRIYLVNAYLNSGCYDGIKSYARSSKSVFTLYSCRSNADRDTLIDGRRTMPRGDAASTETSLGSDYAMYVREVWQCRYSHADDTRTEEYNELKIGSHGDLRYVIPEGAEVTVTDSEARYFKESEHESHKLITPAYNVDCVTNFTVFYPVDKAEDVQPEGTQVYKCSGNQADIIGDYFVYRIHTKQWYADNMYYKDKDKGFFGIYIDNYF